MVRNRSRQGAGWRAPADFRIICACQRHARSRDRWKRSARIASRAFAVLFSVPLTFAAFDFPSAAEALRWRESAPQSAHLEATASPQQTLPLFTDRIREEFLYPVPQRKTLTLEIVKEQFFRTQVPYGDIIYREAKRHGVSPELIAAVVHTESDFRPRLVSDKSAQGLMQIVPGTARLLGLSNAFDPEQNVKAGTRYLRYLMNRFDDPHLALAAYNAGEGNVVRFGGVPPFPETIGYVSKVNARARMYRQRVRNSFLASTRISSAAAH